MNEADILSKLNLGTSKAVIQGQPNSPLGELLQGLAQDVTDMLTKSLDGYDVNASRNLRQSIKPTKVIQDGNTVVVPIEADFYWKFVNFGVNGSEVNHGAPAWGTQEPQSVSFHQAIIEWIPTTGTTLPEQFSSYDSWAWAIQSSIVKNGKKARPFFTDVVNEKLVEYLREPISTLLGRSIEIAIAEPWQLP
jgi:hypothetical protein